MVKNKHIYTASSDKTIKRWVAKKEKAQLTLVGHKASVLRLENIDERIVCIDLRLLRMSLLNVEYVVDSYVSENLNF